MVFLETAELRAKNRIDITMDFWRNNVDKILELNDKEILKNKGSISNAEMKKQAKAIYEKFNTKRKTLDAQLADQQDLAELKKLEDKIRTTNKK